VQAAVNNRRLSNGNVIKRFTARSPAVGPSCCFGLDLSVAGDFLLAEGRVRLVAETVPQRSSRFVHPPENLKD
jgi:hypothetical protein